VAIVVCAGAGAQATIIIPTNFGKGADAELRESEPNVDLSGVALGSNRGGGTNTGAELATRGVNAVTEGAAGSNPTPPPDRIIANHFPTNDRSSVMLLKFDIGALPAAADPFWNDKKVNFQLSTRNDNQAGGSRLWNVKPEFSSVPTVDRTPDMYDLMKFAIRGLEPTGTYVDDVGGDPSALNLTDRVGNPWAPSHYRYDWVEGTGSNSTDTSGVTFYNAPGITPHCVKQGACSDNSIPNSDGSLVQTLGKYDDFDSSTRLIDDTWHWPSEEVAAGYTTTTATPTNLLAGETLHYGDPNGNLKQLLLDAKMAGRDTLTLMVHHNMDTTQTQPNVGIQGTTPTTFLAHNYLVVPKEFGATGLANGLDNSTGAFSPRLLIFVPEPATISLFALGALAVCGLSRRRK
jgi:hypothetical protein